MGPAFLRASWVKDYLDVCGIFLKVCGFCGGVIFQWWFGTSVFGGHLI